MAGAGVRPAQRPIVGARKIVLFCRRVARNYPAGLRWRILRCNDSLTIFGEHADTTPRGRKPQRFAMICTVQDGRIIGLYTQLVPEKLASL